MLNALMFSRTIQLNVIFCHVLKLLVLVLSFGVLMQACEKNSKKGKSNFAYHKRDSIDFWINASKNDAYAIKIRKEFLKKSYQTIKASKMDSASGRVLSTIAYQNLKLADTFLFEVQNKEALAHAIKLKDSFAIGDVHWNYASYYNKKQIYDSAYYHFNIANSYFDKCGYLFEAATTQYGMAFIKGRFKDYSGSEVLTFRAISKFEKIKAYESLYSCFNHLGLLQIDIEEYDKALYYHNKALSFLEEIPESANLVDETSNNFGLIYLKKRDYNKALSAFNQILVTRGLRQRNIYNYARILDNKAYTKLLMKDTVHVAMYLKEALRLRDSLNDKSGMVMSKVHLAHFYNFKQEINKAIAYAKEANSVAKEIKNSINYLESLLLLAKLDTTNAANYLQKYVNFNDSLQTVERKIQNKFIRIDFETDDQIAKAERLTQQKTWILTIGFTIFSILGLLVYIKYEKTKVEKLALENKQQKANEKIYLLSLKQQERLEKEKIKDRNRIAEELHDGVLGKLFGTRMGLGFLNIEGDENLKAQYQLFLNQLQTIEKEIREVSHELSQNFNNSEVNFQTNIQQLVESKSKLAKFKANLKIDENIIWDGFNDKFKVNLYRILQEALLNIVKYASAKQVIIHFSLLNNAMCILIQDDGIGFKMQRKNKGIGIKNMSSRVERLHGTFKIESTLGNGTRINMQIPIK